MTESDLNFGQRRLLNAGAGNVRAKRIATMLDSKGWEEVRLDVDPAVAPDIVGSLTDLDQLFEPASFDGIWCSHVIEHLFAHETYPTLVKFRRVLKPRGFALIMCPDLEAVAEHVLKHGLGSVAYNSPSGPIRALDMLYGHSAAIEQGRHYMAHRTGFTTERLGSLILQAGFAVAHVRSENFEICALALMPGADADAVQSELASSGFDFRETVV